MCVFTWLYLLGVGLSSHLIYLGESSPRKIRGRVTLTVATFLSLGKLSGQFFGLTYVLTNNISNISNKDESEKNLSDTHIDFYTQFLNSWFDILFFFSEIFGSEELWNISLCVPAFLSVVQVIVLPFLPEAPRYLFIEKGDDTACREGWCVSSWSFSAWATVWVTNTAVHWFTTVIACHELLYLYSLSLSNVRSSGL